MFIDSHAHVFWDTLIHRIDEVLSSASKAWVGKIICTWTNLEDSAKSKEMATNRDNLYYTVWIHPNDARDDVDWGLFTSLLDSPKCVAIGETWLDFYHDQVNEETQSECFRKQIDIASKYNLALVIHTRDAWTKVLSYLEGFKWNFVIHCFTWDKDFASRIIEAWAYIWVGGIITFPKAKELRDVLKDFPLDRILLETDCPFLAPQSVRWQINEPKYIPEIASKLAEIKGISITDLEKAIYDNTLRFFGLH